MPFCSTHRGCLNLKYVLQELILVKLCDEALTKGSFNSKAETFPNHLKQSITKVRRAEYMDVM